MVTVSGMTTAERTVRVFLPFAAGFFLLYVFRVINAPIASQLQRDLGISTSALGMLTAVYFLASLIATVPIGMLLDRFGPRRVQPVLLMLVALGAIVFACGERPWELAFGRALIGAAITVTWFAAVKATAIWFPKESLPVVNGWLVAVGSSGAIVAAGPADALADWVGWRGLFLLLAAVSVVVSAMTRLLVPATEPDAAPSSGPSFREVAREVLTDRNFLRFAPLAALAIGTAWAMQGLWAAVWLAEVDGYEHGTVVSNLVIMGCALSTAAPILGVITKRLRRLNISTSTVLAGAAAAFMLVQLLILGRAPLPAAMLWGGAAIFGSLTGLVYALMAELYPKSKIGRANSVLSLMVQGSGFMMQAGIGFLLDFWPKEATGHYPTLAYVCNGVGTAGGRIRLVRIERARIAAPAWPDRTRPSVLKALDRDGGMTCPRWSAQCLREGARIVVVNGSAPKLFDSRRELNDGDVPP